MKVQYFITNIWISRLLSLLYQEVESQDTLFFPSINTNNGIKISRTIIQQCFKEQSSIMIYFKSWQNSSIGNLQFNDLTNVININKSIVLKKHKRLRKFWNFNETYFNRQLYPAANVIISISSSKVLASILEDLRNSIWWNHNARFLIINQGLESSCQHTHELLKIVWKFNILAALYICQYSDRAVALYSFNPFSNVAPKFWNTTMVDCSSRNCWTLLQHLVSKSSGSFIEEDYLSCENLYFDKSIYLNGYNIRTIISIKDNFYLHIDNNKSGFDKYTGLAYDIIATILKYMNFTTTTKFGVSMGYVDENGEPHNCLRDVFYGTVDIRLDADMLMNIWPAHAYPFGSSGLHIISTKTNVGYLEKFLKIFTLDYWIFFFVCSLVSVISLKYFLKQSTMTATLEYIRIFTNVSTLKTPLNWSNKMLFVLFIFAIFYINIVMQCYLKAFTMAPDLAPTIDSLDDLIKSNIIIGGAASYKDLTLFNEKLSGRYYTIDFKECIDRMKNGSHLVCIQGKISLRYLLYESETVHISKNSFFDSQITYLFREDWPLLNRFNRLLLRVSEGGISKYHISLQERYYLKNTEESHAENVGNKKMLKVAFFILVSGWVLSISAAVIEITIHIIIMKYNQYI